MSTFNNRVSVQTCFIVASLACSAYCQIDADKLMQQMIADAKDLAAKRLPAREQLPDWKFAWELPSGVGGGVASEAAYWQQVPQTMGFAGVSEAQARQMVDAVSAQMASAGAAEGLTARDGVITLLMRIQGTDAPTAAKFLNGWETSARMLAGASRKTGDRAAQNQANRTILDGFAAPYKDQSDEQLKSLYAKQASLIAKRTEMSYFKSNNWNALTSAKSEAELVQQNVWLGVVKINLMIADKSKLDNPLDLDSSGAAAVESRLLNAVRGVTDSMLSMKEQKLQQKLADATNDLQRQSLAKEQDEIVAERAAAAQLGVKVETEQFKNLGDNCYYIRINGVAPQNTGLQVALYAGWIRKGEAMAEITLGGNFPQEEMDKEMAHFMSEMSERLSDYDSSVAGMLRIAPAESVANASPAPARDGTAAKPSPTTPAERPKKQGTTPSTPRPPAQQRPQPPSPANDPAEYAQAMALYNQGSFAAALTSFDQALARSPNNPRVLLMRGAAKYYLNDLNGAKADYRAAAEIEPNNAGALKYWAFMELCEGDRETAEKAIDAALLLTPTDVDAILTRGQIAMALDKPVDAEHCFAAVRLMVPGRAQTLYAEGEGSLNRKAYAVAAMQFQGALWLDPNLYVAWYGRAVALTGRGKNKQAINAYREYLKYDNNSSFAQQARLEIDRLKRLD